ncbi:Kef-type K+ ransport system, predicted NAD-binding component [Xenococcus sp. PCC 7305]|uniref:potassium channel family protein n=1 Tax=Xenococcus sp. PCC 7305 TaxID=102125 RepID=UPI0002AC9359|nr:NAD-binding protein [Xenococcus sp. PCC 7305]ELS02142.1 Kef-type K+ ransport system, predicted NAD-binding component [Xenococcus sp. PCC 7305]
MQPKIIVCGLGRNGTKIYSLLKRQGAEVVGISDSSITRQSDEQIVIGDPRANTTLIKAGIRQAQTLVLAHDDDALNLAILTQARILNPRIRIINRLLNQTLGERLDLTLPDHISLSVAALSAPIFTFAALGNKAIGQLKLFNRTWPIQEEIINEDHPWLDKELKELWDDPNRMLIYYLPTQGEIDLVSAIGTGVRLKIGDCVIVGTKPKVFSQRPSWLQKLLKAIFNIPRYQHYARPVTLISLALLSVICLATLTYVSFSLNTSFVDALYFTVGMITGAGGEEQVAEFASDNIKVFTAVMMIVGAIVIGICYALINDFVLGSRFRQALDAARIPRRNHYIVCGLGGIGVQIARQLHVQGYEVVAIDLDHNNRFLHYARSLGIPVILEDASLPSTLKAVNIRHAASLIAVTSHDTVNLEITLTAKALAPKLTSIVRSGDPQFAQSMQEVFEFDRVLSPVELATHSFAAAALGGRILGNGMTQDLLWVAIASMITPGHPFCAQTVEEAAIKADFVPLYLERNSQTFHGWELLELCLQPQDILYLTMPASRLGQLWRSPVANELVLDQITG